MNALKRTPTNLKDSEILRTISLLNRGFLKRKGGKSTVHFTAEIPNAELLFHSIHTANQLSIYGAVSNWCEEFAQRTWNEKESTSEKFAAKENEQ